MKILLDKIYDILYITNPDTDLRKIRLVFLTMILAILTAIIPLLFIDLDGDKSPNQYFISKNTSLLIRTFSIFIVLLGVAIVIAIIIVLLRNYFVFKNLVEEETTFLILLASASPYTGYEIEHVMKRISSKGGDIFRGYGKIAFRVMNLSYYTSVSEAMKIFSSLIPIKRFSRLVKDYLYNKIHGSQREYLSLLSEEMIRELSNSVKRESSMKTNIQAISLLLMTLAPIISASISQIKNTNLPIEIDLFLLLTTIFIIIITPKTPLILRTLNRDRISTYRDLIVLVVSSLIIFILLTKHYMILTSRDLILTQTDPLLISFYEKLSLFSDSILRNIHILMILIGVLGIHHSLEYVNMLRELGRAKDILIRSLSHVRIYKDLGGFDMYRYINPRKTPRSWLLNYIVFSINYMKEIGLVIEETYEKFVDRILEILSIYKSYVLQNLLYVIILLIQPYIFAQTLHMLQHVSGVYEIFLISTIMSSMITSKIVIGSPFNGLFISLTTFLYLHLTR